MKKEEWKQIPEMEGYSISSFGKIISNKRNPNGKLLTGSLDTQGYVQYTLIKNGKSGTFLIHRLMALVFMKYTPINGFTIDHIDNIKTNNRLDNLQIITHRKNCSKDRKGTSKYTGVSWDKSRKKWRSAIYIDGTIKTIGRFKIEKDARDAYLKTLNLI